MSRESYDLKTVVNGAKYKLQATGLGVEKSEFSAEVGKGAIPVTNGKMIGTFSVDNLGVISSLVSNSIFNICTYYDESGYLVDEDFYLIAGVINLAGNSLYTSGPDLHIYDGMIGAGTLDTIHIYINAGECWQVVLRDCTLSIKGGIFTQCIFNQCAGIIEPNANCTFTDCVFENCNITNLDKFVVS